VQVMPFFDRKHRLMLESIEIHESGSFRARGGGISDISQASRLDRTDYSITRLVKNGLVISVTGGSFSSEASTVMNSF
jgi:hypothetical protein